MENCTYIDRNALIAYLGISKNTYYYQRLWEHIPNVQIGRERLYTKEAVDWYMRRKVAEVLTSDVESEAYKKHLREKVPGK